ncbi:portal protein [Burkholderia contaminans]|uniref:portal protein n=1 Tax=Burkholderia contaminans TaxID=488447 RepID=UPI00158A4AEF|nr:hypothetical protein [Burkholderia contaminans]
MAKGRTKAPVEGGKDMFTTPVTAMMNGSQPWTQRGIEQPDSDEQHDASNYFAGSDKAQQGAVRSDKFRDAVPLSDEELGAIIQQQLTDARTFIDLEVGPMRAAAIEAYRGRMDYSDPDQGDIGYLDQALAPAGRSEIASRDVRDTISAMMGDLMRMFTSSDEIVEFEPVSPKDVDFAEQATDYANYVFQKDNDGFDVLFSAFKDALLQKTGIVKVWWDDAETVRTETYSGLDPAGLYALEQDDDVESIEVIQEYTVTPDTMGVPIPTIDARVKRRTTKGRIKIECLPPEEFLIDRRARSLDCDSPSTRGFNLVAHRSMMTTSELVALGYDEDLVREHVTSNELDANVERIARQPWARTVGGFEGVNPALQKVLYCESYAWVDGDGDGVAELHKICTMGPSFKIVAREPVDFIPFAVFHCDKEPHVFFGESIADVTQDIQRLKTQLWRDSLDSLSQSVRPRMAVVEGQVNYEDVLNNETGAIVRMRAPGMVQPLITPFVGADAQGMVDYSDSVLEKRTGVSLQSLGLGADAMQSTTAAAVNQQISSSQGRVELIARTLADGLRQVFKLILDLSCKYQDKARTVQLRGKWVDVDPRYWNADMAVNINVALGTGTAQDKIGMLSQIKATQEQILMQLGPNNPIVSMSQYTNTLTKICELTGFKNASQFFNQIPANQPPPPPPPPQPNPEVIAAQAAQQKAANAAQMDQQRMQLEIAKLQLEQQKAADEAQRLRDKDAAMIALQQYEIELKYGVQLHSASLDNVQADAQHRREQESALLQAQMQHLADAQSNVFNAQQQAPMPGMPQQQSATAQPELPGQ